MFLEQNGSAIGSIAGRLLVLPAVGLALCNIVQAGEVATCGLNIQRGDGRDGPITGLSIRLSESKGMTEVPVGDPSAMMDWAGRVYDQAQKEDEEATDVTVKIQNVRLEYGSQTQIKNVLVLSRHASSMDPNSCTRRVAEPYTGNVSLDLTPKVLKGRYEAALYICERSKPGVKPYPVKKGMVSGSFECALPILHDRKYEPQVSRAEALRTLAQGIWATKAAAAPGLENIRRPLPYLPTGRPATGGQGSGNEEWNCDCSCPAILAYSAEHPCREPCGPEWRYGECQSTSKQEVQADEKSPAEKDDVCSRWARLFETEEAVPPQYAAIINSMKQGMTRECAQMTPEERKALENILKMMAEPK